MRVSDEDRQRAVEELRRHCAAGRIDVDEFASRVERTLAASTLEELDAVRSDLPMLRVPEPAGGKVWAGRSRAITGRLPSTEWATTAPGDGHPPATPERTLLAYAVAVLSVVVVLGAIVIGLVAEWAWAVLLLVGWAIGLAQGRLGRNTRRSR